MIIAREIMHTKPITVEPNLSISGLERILVESRVSGVPVVSRERLVGIVSLRDIVSRIHAERDKACVNVGLYGHPRFEDLPYDTAKDIADLVGERMDRLRVADLMTTDVKCASVEATVGEMAQLMANSGISRLPIVDLTQDGKERRGDSGRLIGLITSQELLRTLV